MNYLLLYLADLLSELMCARFFGPFELLEVVSHIGNLVFVLKNRVSEILTWSCRGSHALGAVSLRHILAASIIHNFTFPTLVFFVDIIDLLCDSRGL